MRVRRSTGSIAQAELTCPACGKGMITFIPRMLAAGVQFACPVCAAQLALGGEAKSIYAESLAKLEAVAAIARK